MLPSPRPNARFLLGFGLLLHLVFVNRTLAQMPDSFDHRGAYQDAWRQVDTLAARGLYRSALENTGDLEQRARAAGDLPQLLKSFLYRSRFQQELEEAGLIAVIGTMEADLDRLEGPARAVLASILAEVYQGYLDSQRWRLRDRTRVEAVSADDPATWSIEDLDRRVVDLYRISLADPDLRQVPIDRFAILLTPQQRAEGLRPTLYDLLAHRAIDHFSNPRSYLTEPANRFEVEDALVFATAEAFAQHDFATPDTLSYAWKTLVILQELTALHLAADGQLPALVDVERKRLRFAHNLAVLPGKDSLYLEALQALEQRYAEHPASAEVSADLVRWHIDRGNRYRRGGDPEARWALVQAREIAEATAARHPGSYGADLCQQQIQSLQRVELRLELESVIVPDKPALMQVRYRNARQLHYRVFAVAEETWMDRRNQGRDETLQKILSSTPRFVRETALPQPEDHQEHITELALDGLPPGRYALFFDEAPDVDPEGPPSVTFFQVSRLAYLESQGPRGGKQFLVVDREAGQPLEGVELALLRIDSRTRDIPLPRSYRYRAVTGPDGLVQTPAGMEEAAVLRLQRGEDVLLPDARYYFWDRSDPAGRTEQATHFFLDRAIYRPGQTIYFKGLALRRSSEQRAEIVREAPVTVTLWDANQQEVAKLELTTNRFGSFQGSFVAPASGLRGLMSLVSSFGGTRHAFRVEEYKRPRFRVELEPLAGTPALGEVVELAGRARTYAGSQVDGATVQYRVVRELQFPWWPYWRGIGPPRGSEQMEIARGVATTDAEGAFTIPFTAVPDASVPAGQQPAYVFRVTVEVTSLAGETRTAERTIRLAELGLTASLQAPAQADRQQGIDLKLGAANLDGIPQAATGTLSVFRLASPDRPRVERLWEAPDEYALEEAEFRALFPHLEYGEATRPADWARREQRVGRELSLPADAALSLATRDWPVGHYLLLWETMDGRGNRVEDRAYVALYDGATGQVPADQLLWVHADGASLAPGDTARIDLASGLPELPVFRTWERDAELLDSRWLTLGAAPLERRIEPGDRGDLHLHLAWVRFNRHFTRTQRIPVPWPGEELEIEYLSFRDRMRPGEEETWELRIAGPAGEKWAAEMVAALYDASLDQFVGHAWGFDPYPRHHYARLSWSSQAFSTASSALRRYPPALPMDQRVLPELQWFGFRPQGSPGFLMELSTAREPLMMRSMAAPPSPPADGSAFDGAQEDPEPGADRDLETGAKPPGSEPAPEALRTNLDETVFFFPELRTDAEGRVRLRFTMNEALTTWRFLGFAHTEALHYGLTQREVVTQKELMVLPNAPRFVREGDDLEFVATVSNLTDGPLSGTATLRLFDAVTGTPADAAFKHEAIEQAFVTEGGRSARLAWRLRVPPGGVQALQYRVMVRAGDYADGEQAALPVLTNRVLLTETLPLPLRGGEDQTFALERLIRSGRSETLSHQRFSLEFTANPAWFAVKALPYLQEFPYACIEQEFNRFYANSLALAVVDEHPRIRAVFEAWRAEGGLESQLTLNPELKSALLEETPWVLQAQSEAEQRRNIALLFDIDRMARERAATLRQLAERQAPSGGWSWFPGGRANRYMTQYIVEGLGRMRRLGLTPDPATAAMLDRALRYLDQALQEEYETVLERVEPDDRTRDLLSPLGVHYLYARSFWLDREPGPELRPALDFFLDQAQRYWLDRSLYEQGLLALALARHDRVEASEGIIRSLEERALHHEALGMYWNYERGYTWYQRPLQTQALMIELFAERARSPRAIEDMQVWLLKQKQTTHWKTTVGTAAAVYALLVAGDGLGAAWLAAGEPLQIRFPDLRRKAYVDRLEAAQATAEAGTGYFRSSWAPDEVGPGLGTIRVENPNPNIAWGAAYWQYWEDMDQVSAYEATPLKLKKALFRRELSERGPTLVPVAPGVALAPGDRIVVRIELRADRAMDYIHMKDLRASGLEPEAVLSTYRWQDGLGYYQSTGDAATHFFFDHLPRGTYVFEYPLRVSHRGDFAAGLTTIQSMYAPEFSSHSEGVRLQVERQAN